MTMYGSVMTHRDNSDQQAEFSRKGRWDKTPEHRAALSASLKGRKVSPEAEARRMASRVYTKKTNHYKTPTYNTWDNMIQRCENTNRREYHWYGERGIKVCERWHDFALFLEDMGERPAGLTLDRTDNDGNYEPENCRWVTTDVQLRNRRPRSVCKAARINECGHPDRTHKARGMCGACYFKWRTQRS